VGLGKKKSKGRAVYRMVLPQEFCSLQRGFYLQPIILEFSFEQWDLSETSKPALIYVRWKKGEKKKVRHPDGSFHEYPILAFYICVNRDLARRGTFRQAYRAVGEIVAWAEKWGMELSKLSREDLVAHDEKFDREALTVFNLERAMARRNSIGMPGTKEVAKQLREWQKKLSARRSFSYRKR
jgi:hypothetical protein